jgi:Mn-dependent DtxR family transcriptional regulator
MSIASSKPRFTDKQGQYLAFIHTYAMLHRRPPAEADMERYFGVTPPSVHRMVVELERRGLIHRLPGQPRSITLTLRPDEVPPLRPQPIETSASRY